MAGPDAEQQDVETDHPHTPAPGADPRPTAGPTIHAAEGIDATLLPPEWECVQALRRGAYRTRGCTASSGFARRTGAAPTGDRRADGPDGPQRDARALFARWLVAQGRLNEGD